MPVASTSERPFRFICRPSRGGPCWCWSSPPRWASSRNTAARITSGSKKEAEVIRETGKQLAELTQRAIERHTPVLEPTEKGLGTVKELGEQMAKLQLNRTEALRDLASVTEKLKDQTKELGKNPAIRKLEQAARSPTGQSPASNAELQKQIDSMQKQLGNPNANADALEKLQKELQKMQQAAAGMSANDSAAAQQQKEQLSQSLADLAKKADELGLSLPSLDEAIKALEAGQIDQFLKDLKFAETDLEKMQAMAKALQQLEETNGSVGQGPRRTVGERPGHAPRNRPCKKMIDQLKSANLSPEQLKKMLAEVSKAIKPGSQYGKVGDFLKQAAQQMQHGQKADAAQSLADAAKELKRHGQWATPSPWPLAGCLEEEPRCASATTELGPMQIDRIQSEGRKTRSRRRHLGR